MTMRWFRKQTKTFLWVVMAGFVAWILFELGADIFRLNVGGQPWEQGVIAKVDGEPITYDVYNQMLQQALEESTRVWKREPTEADRQQVADAVWNQLLQQIRLQKLVRERRLNLTDSTVLTLIRRIPPPEIQQDSVFWDSTGFNYNAYLSLLQNPQAAPFFINYEMRLRREIPIQMTWTDLVSAMSEHPDIQRKRAEMEHTTLQAVLFRFVYDRIPDSAVHYTDADLQAYYTEHRDAYRQEARVQLLEIFVPKVPSAEDSSLAWEKIQAALEELQGGKDFTEVARYYAEIPQLKEQGGRLGTYTPQTLPFPDSIKNKLISAPDGEIIGPLPLSPGYVLFRVFHRPKDSLVVDAIAVRVEPSASTQENLLNALQTFVRSTPPEMLDSLARQKGYEAYLTPPFRRTLGFIPRIGPRSDILSWLKKARPGEVSPVFSLPGKFVVVVLNNVIPAGIPPLDSVRTQVERDYVLSLKRQKAQSLADSALRLLKEGASFSDIQEKLTAYRPEVIRSPKFQLRQPIPGVGLDMVLSSLVYGLPADSTVHGPFALDGAVYLVQKTLHEPPAETTLDVGGYTQRRQQTLIQILVRDIQRELTSPEGVEDFRARILRPVS